jgi:hypothetical protein
MSSPCLSVPDLVIVSFCLSVPSCPASQPPTDTTTIAHPPPLVVVVVVSSSSPPQSRTRRPTDFLHPGSHARDWPAAGETFAIGIGGRGYLSTLTGHPCGDLYKLSMRRSRPPARSMDFPAWLLALGPCPPRMNPIRHAQPCYSSSTTQRCRALEFPLYFLFPFFLSG